MSHNNVIQEKKNALLAYRDKILKEINYYERSIEDFRASHTKNIINDDDVDSSDSEDDFLEAIDTGPTIIQLKMQQNMMRTCLQATQELTSLTVLQSEVNMLVEEPKFEGEKPVTEAGTWREVTAECRIDLVPFTIMFFMHRPDRKFGAPSFRGLRVIPVKSAHETELAKSVLHTLKLPSDAIEVLKSYAAGYRSRRTTLARLANKYANALFMEPHPEGGFVLKCADLLELSWRLENKWSPVAPFHHRMKFDLEYMDESYIKIITQAHKQLLDPSIQTDERTLLLAKIISTCLEARGPIDPESDLESKTTERDNDMDIEKRDSEVMAPPKSLPKKVKQKTKENQPNAGQKRSMDDGNGENDVASAKKMKNDVLNVPESSVRDSNARKNKMNDVFQDGAKKRKTSDVVDKNVVSTKNVKKTSDNKAVNKPKTGNTKSQNAKEAGSTEVGSGKNNSAEEISSKSKAKSKDVKDSGNTEAVITNAKNKNTNAAKNTEELNKKSKLKSKNVKETENKENNAKIQNKNTKETPAEINIAKDTVINYNKDDNIIRKDIVTNVADKVISKPKNKTVKEPSNIEKDKITNVKSKTITSKEINNDNDNIRDKDNDAKMKNSEKNKQKPVMNTKSDKKTVTSKTSEKIPTKDAERPQSKNIEKKSTVTNTKNTESNTKTVKKSISTIAKAKTIIDSTESKENNVVASAKNDEQTKEVLKKDTKNKDRPQITNKVSTKNINIKFTEKNAANIKNKDKISQINTVSENNVTRKLITNNTAKADTIEKIISKTSTEPSNNNINKKMIQKPIKTLISHKIASHRNALKGQNPQKAVSAGNTKVLKSGNNVKENGVKSKIPQKKSSLNTDIASKKNILRISPRKNPSAFKRPSQENSLKQKMMKMTNIPQLLKKPAPKISK